MTDTRAFEAAVLPCLDAAYNLARWLLRDSTAAEDAVQESALRALRYFHALRGSDARPWFLGIVRNTCYTQLERHRSLAESSITDDDELDRLRSDAGQAEPDPAQIYDRGNDRRRVDAALRALPPAMREVIVLRELEGLEYAEIAHVASIPIGTVMSRLSRARSRLKALLTQAGVGE